MVLVGRVEPSSDAVGGRPDWISIIQGHPQLSPIAPVEGINTFTQEPILYRARPDTAQVWNEGKRVVLIHWAADDSRRLVVWSDPGYEDQIRKVAEDVAGRLGWQLVRADAA